MVRIFDLFNFVSSTSVNIRLNWQILLLHVILLYLYNKGNICLNFSLQFFMCKETTLTMRFSAVNTLFASVDLRGEKWWS